MKHPRNEAPVHKGRAVVSSVLLASCYGAEEKQQTRWAAHHLKHKADGANKERKEEDRWRTQARAGEVY
jgi:hypothetical protein